MARSPPSRPQSRWTTSSKSSSSSRPPRASTSVSLGVSSGSKLTPAPSILQQHAAFLVSLTAEGIDGTVGDDEVREYLNAETLRGMLRDLSQRANIILSAGEVWQTWIDWELSLLEHLSGADRWVASCTWLTGRKEQIQHVGDEYLQRLQVPHVASSETSSAYSTFCSKHCPDDYEDRLVQATKASQDAKWKLEREKRHGRTRNDLEEQLVRLEARY